MMPNFEEIWICRRCKWEGQASEIRKEVIHHATLIDPEEWEWYCPECNRTDSLEEKEDGPLCKWCEENSVPDEDEVCNECRTCHAEEQADAARGH